jgi:hypothetical protein
MKHSNPPFILQCNYRFYLTSIVSRPPSSAFPCLPPLLTHGWDQMTCQIFRHLSPPIKYPTDYLAAELPNLPHLPCPDHLLRSSYCTAGNSLTCTSADTCHQQNKPSSSISCSGTIGSFFIIEVSILRLCIYVSARLLMYDQQSDYSTASADTCHQQTSTPSSLAAELPGPSS